MNSRKLRLLTIVVIIALLAVFIITGDFASKNSNDQNANNGSRSSTQSSAEPSANRHQPHLKRVRSELIEASAITQRLALRGQTKPNRRVRLSAEAAGRVITINVDQGDQVQTGQTLFELDPQALPERIDYRKAQVKRAQLTYDRAQQLSKQGLLSDDDLAQALVELKSAEAELKSLEVNLASLSIKAPFDGIYDKQFISTGQYVRPGDELAVIASYTPLLISLDVSAKEARQIATGQVGRVELSTGDKLTAEVNFISREAHAGTNTYEVQMMSIDKLYAAIGTGVSASVSIDLEEVLAQAISPALFELNEHGDLTVKHLDTDLKVISSVVQIVSAQADGAWVTGLPPQTHLITQGHGFVVVGEQVEQEEESKKIESEKKAAVEKPQHAQLDSSTYKSSTDEKSL